jgi:pimeloyl-ACP methyl ester carboxylesterase
MAEPAAANAIAPPVPLPPGRALDLPGRGTTWIRELTGPPNAPTVFLLHGWLATGDLNWFASYQSLSEHFRVLAIDHRGHGRGIRTHDRFRLTDCADDVAAVIHQLGIGRVIATGYSMGGPIAQLLWHRHPRMVQGLVLCATASDFRRRPGERAAFTMATGSAHGVSRAMPERLRQAVRERVTGARYDGETPQGRWARTEFRRHDVRMLLEAGRQVGRFDSAPWIGRVDIPTAVVLTEQDRLVPPRNQMRLAQAIPHARVFPVPGGHVVCSAEPELFVPVLVEACRDVESRSGQPNPAG